ncbi:MAG: hypothetical protein AB7F28_04380 [Candidatus Margulisiibacteriota bacterium]
MAITPLISTTHQFIKKHPIVLTPFLLSSVIFTLVVLMHPTLLPSSLANITPKQTAFALFAICITTLAKIITLEGVQSHSNGMAFSVKRTLKNGGIVALNLLALAIPCFGFLMLALSKAGVLAHLFPGNLAALVAALGLTVLLIPLTLIAELIPCAVILGQVRWYQPIGASLRFIKTHPKATLITYGLLFTTLLIGRLWGVMLENIPIAGPTLRSLVEGLSTAYAYVLLGLFFISKISRIQTHC